MSFGGPLRPLLRNVLYRSSCGLIWLLRHYKVPSLLFRIFPPNIALSCSLIRPFCAVRRGLYRIFENADSNDLLKAKQVLYTDKTENQLSSCIRKFKV